MTNTGNSYEIYSQARALDRAGQEAEALVLYQKIFQMGYSSLPVEDQPGFFLSFGSTLRNLKEGRKSLEILSQGAELFPQHAALRIFLAFALYSEGKFKSASQRLFEALALDDVHSSLKSYENPIRWYAQNIESHPYPPFTPSFNTKTRAVALALLKRPDGRVLLSAGYDSVKGENFYRLLGGGIEFGEKSYAAVQRELMEELELEVDVGNRLATIENIFTFEGQAGHEIIFVHEASLKDLSQSHFSEKAIMENGRPVGKAVWRSRAEIAAEGAKIYPDAIETLL